MLTREPARRTRLHQRLARRRKRANDGAALQVDDAAAGVGEDRRAQHRLDAARILEAGGGGEARVGKGVVDDEGLVEGAHVPDDLRTVAVRRHAVATAPAGLGGAPPLRTGLHLGQVVTAAHAGVVGAGVLEEDAHHLVGELVEVYVAGDRAAQLQHRVGVELCRGGDRRDVAVERRERVQRGARRERVLALRHRGRAVLQRRVDAVLAPHASDERGGAKVCKDAAGVVIEVGAGGAETDRGDVVAGQEARDALPQRQAARTRERYRLVVELGGAEQVLVQHLWR